MESFVWDTQYETKLERVDQQHRGLVALINGVAEEFTDRRVPTNLDAAFEKLASYAARHFDDEEALMREVGVDRRHADRHEAIHATFMDEVARLKRGLDSDDPKGLEHLLAFLVHWLSYHILGADQDMARQIHAIRTGASPAAAFEREELDHRRATKPLVRALDRLFDILSKRNRELYELNLSLEARVDARTRELREANSKLETLSSTDGLTGLPNRRHAMRTLQTLWAESTPKQNPLVAIMIDADHFKDVNDTYGHAAGDAVLLALAQELQHSFRNDDIVCRLGGDEFFVICPSTDLDGGLLVAEQTRAKVAALRVAAGEGVWQGSVSLGVAVRTSDMQAIDELVKAADEGVYAAKAAGKNSVRTAQIG